MGRTYWKRIILIFLSVSGSAEALACQFSGRGVAAGNGRAAYLALEENNAPASRATLMDVNKKLSRSAPKSPEQTLTSCYF